MPGFQKLLTNVKNPVFENGLAFVTYGFMDKDYGGPHYGVDLTAGQGRGDYVIADADGVVSYVKDTVLGGVSSLLHADALGNNVKITHSDNDVSRFCHLKYGSVCVSEGQYVKKGERIGYMGSTGYCFGAHLHYERWVNGVRVDPVPYLCGEREFIIDPRYTLSPKTKTINTLFRSLGIAAIRTAPSKNAYLLDRCKRDAVYAMHSLIETEGQQWLKHEGCGYFSLLKDYTELFEPCGEYIPMNTTEVLNVRYAPSLHSEKREKPLHKNARVLVKKGTPVTAEGYSWCEILLDNRFYWVAAEFLTNTKS